MLSKVDSKFDIKSLVEYSISSLSLPVIKLSFAKDKINAKVHYMESIKKIHQEI